MKNDCGYSCLNGDFQKIFDSVVGRAGFVLGQSYDEPAVRKAVAVRARSYAAQLQRLALAGSAEPARRDALNRLLVSFDARFCSLILSRKGSPISLDEANAIAAALNPRADCGEPISYYEKSKPEGGSRPIWIFGEKRRALQRLVRDVLHVLWGPTHFDFAQKGKGKDAALRLLMNSTAKKGGPRWFLTADITNCFGSFDKEKLLTLIPLPKNVIRHSILISEQTTIITNEDSTNTSEKATPAGLPQGSLVSFYIACKLLEPILMKLSGKLVMSHADDILVGCGTEKECETNKLLLGDLLADHPAGPLFMKSAVAELRDPIDYLGYRMRRRWLRYGGGVRLVPSPKSFDRFHARLAARLVESSHAQIDDCAIEYTNKWMAAHSLWDCSENAQTNVYADVWHITSAVKWQKKQAASG